MGAHRGKAMLAAMDAQRAGCALATANLLGERRRVETRHHSKCWEKCATSGSPETCEVRASRLYRAGWTVVELLLAVGLGLLLTLLASGLLLATAGSHRHHSDLALLDDSGRYALDLMAQAIRQAAYLNWDSAAAPPGLAADVAPAISGWDGRSVAENSDGISVPLAGVAGLAGSSDVLALRFAGHGAGNDHDGSSVNCAGFGVAAPAEEDRRGWSIFYVAADAQGTPELRCKYRSSTGNWGADAIVRGVASFQVLYGLDTDHPADGIANRYLNASAVRALDAALVAAGATPAAQQRDLLRKSHWHRVCSIKLGLLLQGDAITRVDRVPARFDLFSPTYADSHGDDLGVRVREDDLPEAERWRPRRLFGLTVALRNFPELSQRPGLAARPGAQAGAGG